ncbi:hypothetical protein [Methanospirillum sp.]
MLFRMAATVETRARTRLPSIIFTFSQDNQFRDQHRTGGIGPAVLGGVITPCFC